MQDDLDAMLQGTDPSQASQAKNDGQADDSIQGQPVEQQTPEEIEFNSLSGSTQDRIKKLAQDKRRMAEELETLRRGQTAYIPPAPGSNYQNPDEEAAIKTLASKGIATDEKVNRLLDERLNALRWENEQLRLESKYSGKGDTPHYVREEVEDFINSHPQYRGYSAEDVFRYKMFPDEFMNLEIQKRGSKTGQSPTLRPTARVVSQQQGLTPEYIADRTDIRKYPDALEWQEEHKHEIDKVLSQMQEE